MTITYRKQIRPQLARLRDERGAFGYKYTGWRWFITEETAFPVRNRMDVFGGMRVWAVVENKVNR